MKLNLGFELQGGSTNQNNCFQK